MSEGLFREEALRHRSGARTAGDVLRLPPEWTRWTFQALVAVFLAAVAYALLGTVPVTSRGLARGTSAYFPEQDRSRLSSGLEIRLGERRAAIVAVDPSPVAIASALEDLGGASWPSSPPPTRLVRVEISAGDAAVSGETVDAFAPAGRRRLATTLIPALGSARER